MMMCTTWKLKHGSGMARQRECWKVWGRLGIAGLLRLDTSWLCLLGVDPPGFVAIAALDRDPLVGPFAY